MKVGQTTSDLWMATLIRRGDIAISNVNVKPEGQGGYTGH